MAGSIDELLDAGVAHYEGDYEVVKLDTTERRFESDVELCLEQAGWKSFRREREKALAAGDKGCWSIGQEDYDRKLGLKTRSLIGFVKETQPEEWAKIEKLNGAKTEEAFLKRVCDLLEPHGERDGLLYVLRNGFKMAPNASFKLCYFEPASTRNPTLEDKFKANRFEIVRQLAYGTRPDNALDAVDVVLFLNGIPVITMELKNNLSGQRTDHAVRQYKTDRSSKEILFKPNRRSIVHFAVDQETAQMTTWLQNGKTVFLPFNQGNGLNGGGNPANPNGYRTEYLYKDVLAPSSLLDILQRFIRIEYNDDGTMSKVIFPRFHQLAAVRAIAEHAYAHGTGNSYLVQHSAGSGKSNTIAWLAHRLSTLHDENDSAVFDSIIVLTDRRNLDAQLSSNIAAVDHKTGVVVRVEEKDGSAGLRDAINSGAKIITSTIQKFPLYLPTDEGRGQEVRHHHRRSAFVAKRQSARQNEAGLVGLERRPDRCRDAGCGKGRGSRAGRRAGHPCPRDERARAASQPLVLCFHCHAETLDVGGVWAHWG